MLADFLDYTKQICAFVYLNAAGGLNQPNNVYIKQMNVCSVRGNLH